jgi:tripartite-type tricarboxylate transporter receptor subunit TctC
MSKKTLVIALLALSAGPGFASEPYPTRPVKLIVPFAPGSATDVLGRLMAERLAQALGQAFVVENKPGAAGAIGTASGAKSPADGYTLTLAGSGPFGVNPAIYTKLAYDPVKDFAPIINLASTPQVMVTAASGPYKSLAQFIGDARATGRAIDYASIGIGSTSHLAGLLFQSVVGLPMVHVPFKGNSDAQMQLMGGTVPVMFDAMPGVLGAIKSNRLRGLAVAAKERSPFAPEIPTFAEAGYPDVVVTGWIGLVAPAGTPDPIIDRLNAELNKTLQDPAVRDKLRDAAFAATGGTRAEFASYIKAEIGRWTKLAKETKLQLD